ncbi:4Fe-4S binding protein [Atopobium sp. oral taxon 416]|nr:4Fe-4S binding protein [Atopobium sp. oral taxon 416]
MDCLVLGRAEDGPAVIDPNQCIGCGQCIQSCPFGCIKEGE